MFFCVTAKPFKTKSRLKHLKVSECCSNLTGFKGGKPARGVMMNYY